MADANRPRNPTGKNQYNCPPKHDAAVECLLRDYHRRGIHDRKTVVNLLKAEHGISMSMSTLARRRNALGLLTSGKTTRATPDDTKRDLVLAQMAKDPLRKHGPRSIKEAIAAESGIHLTREYIASAMRAHDPAGFRLRDPATLHRPAAPTPAPAPRVGVHREWTCTTSDKLARIGFPTWSVRDRWSGKWLGMFLVPARTYDHAVAFLKLGVIQETGGMPPALPRDEGGELPPPCAHVESFRRTLAPQLSADEDALLRSIRKLAPERSLLQESWVNTALAFWDAGAPHYDASNPRHHLLAQFLWSTLLRQELAQLNETLNTHRPRKDKKKARPGPSGIAPSVAYALYADHGGQNCLCPVPHDAVRAIVARVDARALLAFVTPEYEARAQAVLGARVLAFENVWAVFREMLPCL